MAYTIPSTSHELLQQILDEIKSLHADLKHDSEVVNIHALSPEQTAEIVKQVQAKLLLQARRNRYQEPPNSNPGTEDGM